MTLRGWPAKILIVLVDDDVSLGSSFGEHAFTSFLVGLADYSVVSSRYNNARCKIEQQRHITAGLNVFARCPDND